MVNELLSEKQPFSRQRPKKVAWELELNIRFLVYLIVLGINLIVATVDLVYKSCYQVVKTVWELSVDCYFFIKQLYTTRQLSCNKNYTKHEKTDCFVSKATEDKAS